MQIIDRLLRRRRRPQTRLRNHLGPWGWPRYIRHVQRKWGLSTRDLATLTNRSPSTIRNYRSDTLNRIPPESFKETFYKLVKVLETAPAEVLLTLDGRQGIIKGKDEIWHVVSLGTGVFLNECEACGKFHVSQYNALRCHVCRKEFR